MNLETAKRCEPAMEMASIYANMRLWLGFHVDTTSLCSSMARYTDNGALQRYGQKLRCISVSPRPSGSVQEGGRGRGGGVARCHGEHHEHHAADEQCLPERNCARKRASRCSCCPASTARLTVRSVI